MFLDLRTHDYDRHIYPHIKNGIIIDTSIFLFIVDGIVCTKFSNKKSQEFENVSYILDRIKMNNKWSKFFITPHILTEICNNIRNKYNKLDNFREIIKEVIPLIGEMEDKIVKKEEILRYVDTNYPVLEVGDISIFVIADDFAFKKVKIAIFANDDNLNKKYQDSKDVMVIDYKSIILNTP
jgi:predicted nucleic acid-binding protein